MPHDFQALENKLGHAFADRSLLLAALTHPSFGHEKRTGGPNNQRLEFLGDAVLQLLSSELIYQAHAELDEGGMTRLRAARVSRSSMCDLARSLDLGAHMIIGRGEESAGGRSRPSNLADAMESVIGAIYLDGGWAAAAKFRDEVLAGFWRDSAEDDQSIANPKGTLQEKLQALGPDAPSYETLCAEGPDHDRTFTVSVRWRGAELATGTGRTKKEAEASAAARALQTRSWHAPASAAPQAPPA